MFVVCLYSAKFLGEKHWWKTSPTRDSSVPRPVPLKAEISSEMKTRLLLLWAVYEVHKKIAKCKSHQVSVAIFGEGV